MTDLPLLLLRQMIQVSVLAATVWLVTRAFARERAHLAHALWALVLLKALTPPLLASPWGPFCWWTPTLVTASTTQDDRVRVPARPLDSLGKNQPAPLSSTRTSTPANGDSAIVVTLPARGDRESRPTTDPVAAGPSHRWPFAGHLDQDPGSRELSRWLAYGWVLTAVAALGITSVRVARFLFRVHRHTVATPAELTAAVTRLGKAFGVQRRLQVCVVDVAFGPAVIGFWRPTILLPRIVVEDSTVAQLEPLLAHELIHVRRGDLRWALVQATASSVWWFHPLVRLAAKRLQGEAERCCDEETVRSLGCKPAAYARALLDVLERKQRLQVAPVLPGVRPLDITTRRLERIMRIGQGSHARSPHWVTLILLAGAAIALPGASWGQNDAAPDSSTAPPTVPTPPTDHAASAAAPEVLSSAAVANGAGAQRQETAPASRRDTTGAGPADDSVLYQWDAAEALAKIQRDERCDIEEAKVCLRAMIHMHLTNLAPQQPLEDRLVSPPQDAADSQVRSAPIAPRSCTIMFHHTQMIVQCHHDQHDAIEQIVARIARHGTAQIVIQTRLITIPSELMSKLAIKWTIYPQAAHATSTAETQRPQQAFARQPGVLGDLPHASTDNGAPTLVSIVDKPTAKQLHDQFQSDTRVNVLQAPKITLFNAQQATIQDLTQRPFVVSVTETLEPVIRLVSEGLAIDVRPTVHDARDRLSLDCTLVHHRIDSVNEVSFQHAASRGPDGVTLQVPTVMRQAMVVNDLELPLDGTILIAGMHTAHRDQEEILIAMLDFAMVDPDAELSGPPVAPTEKDQYVIVSPKISHNRFERIAASLKAAGITKFRTRGGYLELDVREWHEAHSLVAELLREVGKDEPTPTERPDLVITADGESDGSHELLFAWLKAHELPGIAIQGNIRYQVDENGAVLSGNKLTVQDGTEPADFVLRGELGEIRFPRAAPHELSAQLKGEAQVQIRSEELEVTADEIQIDGPVLALKGNVRLKHKGTSLDAESLVLRLDDGQAPANQVR